MKKRFLFMLVVIFLGVMFMAPQLMAGDHCKTAKKCCSLEKCIPNLTADQKADIEKLHQKSKERMDALHKKAEKLESELKTLKMDPAKKKQIDSRIDELFKVKASVKKEWYATGMAVSKILSDEQKKQLESKKCFSGMCMMKHCKKDCCKKACKKSVHHS